MVRMDNKHIWLYLKGKPLGKLDDDSYYSMGYNDFTLADLFDGYIFLKPISGLSSCSIDYNFFAAPPGPAAGSFLLLQYSLPLEHSLSPACSSAYKIPCIPS